VETSLAQTHLKKALHVQITTYQSFAQATAVVRPSSVIHMNTMSRMDAMGLQKVWFFGASDTVVDPLEPLMVLHPFRERVYTAYSPPCTQDVLYAVKMADYRSIYRGSRGPGCKRPCFRWAIVLPLDNCTIRIQGVACKGIVLERTRRNHNGAKPWLGCGYRPYCTFRMGHSHRYALYHAIEFMTILPDCCRRQC
jgi:hypothetical protein